MLLAVWTVVRLSLKIVTSSSIHTFLLAINGATFLAAVAIIGVSE